MLADALLSLPMLEFVALFKDLLQLNTRLTERAAACIDCVYKRYLYDIYRRDVCRRCLYDPRWQDWPSSSTLCRRYLLNSHYRRRRRIFFLFYTAHGACIQLEECSRAANEDMSSSLML